MSDFADILANLSPEQQELFRLRLAKLHRESAPPADLPIPRQPRTSATFPLSFGQQRLWFLDQLMPGQLSYVIPMAVRLSGTLDRAALDRSFHALLHRHEALRTTIDQAADGQPVQVIAPAQPFDAADALPLIDLADVPDDQRSAEAQRRATTEIRRPFDLQQGPLIRAVLLRLDAQEHWLVLAMHHIIADAWSMGVLIRELAALYGRAVTQPTAVPTLPEPPIQYIDYALWQRDRLAGNATSGAGGTLLDQQIGYWRQQLADVPALDLPTDHPRPPMQTFRGAVHALKLPLELSGALNALSQREGVTLFMTLLAAWQVLLQRYSGQDDIAVGSPIANRTRAETESVIGFFANMLVLRSDLSGNPAFRELLQRVRAVCLQAYNHQDLPFEMVVDAVQPKRDLSRNPLFQVMFVLQNTPSEPLNLPDLLLYPLELMRGAAQFDLTLELTETTVGVIGRLEYNTDLFSAARITRIADHFKTLLQAIVDAPDQRIADLPLLDAVERRHLLDLGHSPQNVSPVVDAAESCLHQLITAQAARTPDATALVYAQQTLSYAELDQRSNQLAHHLRALGVGPETLVGVCFDRSLDLVVALLAVLKAGGAYLPLDPHYPAARLQFMLTDAAAPVLLTQTKLAAQFTDLPATVCLDRDQAAIARWPVTPPPTTTSGEHPAYVIYTSGSTGTPKGVVIPHRAVGNFLTAMQHTLGLRADDRLVAVTTLSFDIAVLELFLALTVGARTILASREAAADGVALAALLAETRATIIQATPVTWRLLLAAGWTGDPDLTILAGGEAVTLELAQQLRPRCRALWNMYGPTETTVWSTMHALSDEQPDAPISIGRPIANTDVYVLDAQMQPVPLGIPGELLIGGAGVARGYLNQSALTAARFVPDPFSSQPGARLYRTGDRVRYRDDGAIEFLGRIDQQIKLRGFRIELGEIEAALSEHADVQQCAVAIRGSGDDRYIVAYVVEEPRTENQEPSGEPRTKNQEPGMENREPRSGEGNEGTTEQRNNGTNEQRNNGDDTVGSQFLVLGSANLRRFLQQKLPDYMLPAMFVRLDALPLTANGKLNRQALPTPDESRSRAAAYVAPRTPIEQVLVAVWSDVLEREQIGVEDNFFELRGHSLLAVQVISRLKDVFPIDVPLQMIFEAPTIAELAARIAAIGAERQIELDRIAELFIELYQLSDDEVSHMLAEQDEPPPS